MFDFSQDAKKETAENPLWKVQCFLNELNNNTARMWIPMKWLGIDKQTLGFQGWSRIKLHITYKNKGDGFQCDAVCDDSYMFSFNFHHKDLPPLPKEFKDKLPDLLPTAMDCLACSLSSQRLDKIFMDNLFNSQKLFTVLHMAQCLAHGIVDMSHLERYRTNVLLAFSTKVRC
jgi:hypothetical protein